MSQSIIDLSRRAFIGGAAALGATSLIIPEFAFAETAAEKQAEADAVRNQLVGLQADLETAGENDYAALDEQESAQRSMEEQQVKIDETTEEIEGLQDRLSTRARSMYRSGSTTFIDFLLGASSFAEFTQNWELLNQINANDADLVDQTKAAREQLQAAKGRVCASGADRRPEGCGMQADPRRGSGQGAERHRSHELPRRRGACAARAGAGLRPAAAAAAAQAAGGGGGCGCGCRRQRRQRPGRRIAATAATRAAATAAASTGGGSSRGGGGSSGGGGGTIVYPGGGGSAGDNSAAYSYACSRIGCPYVWGAEGPDSFDCSGLVTWAYRQLGIELPHQSEAQMASCYSCGVRQRGASGRRSVALRPRGNRRRLRRNSLTCMLPRSAHVCAIPTRFRGRTSRTRCSSR